MYLNGLAVQANKTSLVLETGSEDEGLVHYTAQPEFPERTAAVPYNGFKTLQRLSVTTQ